MQTFAHAKINLSLRILAREAGGFHRIESLFARIALADSLHIDDGPPGIDLIVQGEETGPVEDNLVYRAAATHADALGTEPAVRIRLDKRVPVGSGLGGGSSDAAATLSALERRSGSRLGPGRLHRLACALGSDVPFFMGAPFALAWGRGERALEIPPPPDRPVVLAIADPAVRTTDAYRAISGHGFSIPDPLPPVAALSTWEGIADMAVNDFEDALRPRLPRGFAILDRFRGHGALLARLTGTGAAVFGVFPDEAAAQSAAGDAATHVPDARIIVTRTHFRTPGRVG